MQIDLAADATRYSDRELSTSAKEIGFPYQ
jgi:hypothetical protein